MTLGEFRKLSEGMPDDTPILSRVPSTSSGYYDMACSKRLVVHTPRSSHAEWWPPLEGQQGTAAIVMT